MKKLTGVALVLLSTFSTVALARRGYITEKQLLYISTEMTKQDVVRTFGRPKSVRCSQDSDGHILELYTYHIKGRRTSLERAVVACGSFATSLLFLPFLLYITEPEPISYSVWFHEGNVVQFGTYVATGVNFL